MCLPRYGCGGGGAAEQISRGPICTTTAPVQCIHSSPQHSAVVHPQSELQRGVLLIRSPCSQVPSPTRTVWLGRTNSPRSLSCRCAMACHSVHDDQIASPSAFVPILCSPGLHLKVAHVRPSQVCVRRTRGAKLRWSQWCHPPTATLGRVPLRLSGRIG